MGGVEVLGKVACHRWVHTGLWIRVVYGQESARAGRPRILSYYATLDVPDSTVRTISERLAARRKVHDLRPAQRAAAALVQAVMVLRCLLDVTTMKVLARDSGISLNDRLPI